MDLNLLRLDTLIPAVSCCEFYAKNHQLYVLMFDTDDIIFCWYSDFILHTQEYIHSGHTGINRLTETFRYILTPHVLWTHQLPVLHWMNILLVQTIALWRSTMLLLFKNDSLVEDIYLLISVNKTKSFLWNTKNTVRNSVNEQNTYTTHREKGNTRKVWLVLVCGLIIAFTPILPTLPSLW